MENIIIKDEGELITDWICEGLKENTSWLGEHLTFGIIRQNKLIGGIIFHDYRPNQDIWLTIFTKNKKWCSKAVLKFIFGVAFADLQCRRINLLVSKSNAKCLNFVLKTGFRLEGCLRSFRENGEDCYVLGMLKNECNFYKGEKNE